MIKKFWRRVRYVAIALAATLTVTAIANPSYATDGRSIYEALEAQRSSMQSQDSQSPPIQYNPQQSSSYPQGDGGMQPTDDSGIQWVTPPPWKQSRDQQIAQSNPSQTNDGGVYGERSHLPPLPIEQAPRYNSQPQPVQGGGGYNSSPPPAQYSSQPQVQASQGQDCGIQFDAAIHQDQRTEICQVIAQNPDLAGTITSVDYSPTPMDAKGQGNAYASIDAQHGRMTLYDGALNKTGWADRFAIAHEAGHSAAEKLFGSVAPPPNSEVYQAMEQEAAGVSSYSYTDKEEQFADMYAASVTNDPRLDRFPRTKAAIEQIRRSRGNG